MMTRMMMMMMMMINIDDEFAAIALVPYLGRVYI